MSNLQFGTLRFIRNHSVTLEDIQIYNLTTFGSLVQRGWVTRKGQRVTLTRAGEDAFDLYQRADCNYRQHAGDISDRVRTLLHIGELQMLKHERPEPVAKAG